MFIGHYAPALLLKTRTPHLPLWALFVAVEGLDYLWSVFILAGLERARFIPGFTQSNGLDLYDMPYSHSAVATVGWSLLAFAMTAYWQRAQPGRWSSSLAIALAVASHFLLDLVVHVKDLPLTGSGSLKLGFGLWNDRLLAMLVESTLFVGAVLALTFSGQWRRSRGWWLLGGTMSVLCLASFFIPTPTTPVEIALSGLSLYVLFPLLAWRVERQVTSAAASSPSPG